MRWIACGLLWLCCSAASGQRQVFDSLQRKALRPAARIEHLRIFNALAEMAEFYAPRSQKYYAESALKLAQGLNNKKEYARALLNYGFTASIRGDYAGALHNGIQALAIIQPTQDSVMMGKIWLKIANWHRHRFEYDSTQYYVQKALTLAARLNDSTFYASALSEQGQLFVRKRQYSKAMEYFFRARALLHESQDYSALALLLIRMANAENAQNNYQQGLNYAQQSLMRAKQEEDSTYIIYSQEAMGLALSQLRRFPEAELVLQECLLIADSLHSPNDQQDVLLALSTLYEEQGNTTKALKYYKQFVETIQKMNSNTKTIGVYEFHSYQTQLQEQQLTLLRQQAEADRNTRLYLLTIGALALFLVAVLAYGIIIRQRRQKDQKAAEQEKLFRILTENMADIVALHAPEGHYMYISPSVEKITGYSPQELQGKNPYDFMHPADVPIIQKQQHHVHLQSSNKIITTDPGKFRFHCKSGNYLWIETTTQNILNPDGSLANIVSISRNITDRIKAEHQAAQERENLQTILSTMPVGATVSRSTNILFANTAICLMLGYDRDELLSLPDLSVLIHPEDKPTVFEYHRRALLGEYTPPSCEAQFYRRDGSLFWLELSAFRMSFEGEPAVMTTYINLTRRKNAELALRASEESLRATVDNTPFVAVQWYNEQGEVLYWNKASEILFGWTSEEAMGKTLDKLIHTPEEAAAFLEILHRIEREGIVVGPVEYPVQTRLGEQRYCLSTTFAIGGAQGDDTRRFVCMDIDITEQKHAERELRQRERQLSALINNTNDIIFSIDLEQRFITFNQTLANSIRRFFQIELKPGMSALAIVANNDELTRQWQEYYRRAFTGEQFTIETFQQTPVERYHEISFNPIRNEEQTIQGVAVFLRDVTQRKATDIALRQSEATIRSVVESLSEGLLVHDVQGRIRMLNPAAQEILGGSLPDLHHLLDDPIATNTVIKELWTFIREDGGYYDSSELPSFIVLQSGKPINDVIMGYQKTSGQILWLSVNAYPINNNDGVPDAVVVTFSDITRRRNAERTLKEREIQLTALINSTEDSIYSVDSSYRLQIYNTPYFYAARATFGIEIAPDMNIMDFLPEFLTAERDLWKTTLDRALAGERFSNVYSPGFTGGEPQYFECTYNPIRDANGMVIGVVAFNRDITAIKRVENLIRKSEILLRQTGRVAKVGGWSIELTNNNTMPEWTETTYDIHEVEYGTSVGLNEAIENFYAPEYHQMIRELVQSAIQSAEPFEYELPFVTARGNHLWVHVQGTVDRENGAPSRVYGTIQDITERKHAQLLIQQQVQDLEAKNAEMERFIYTVSHDLKSPLITIKGFLGMVADDIKAGNIERAERDLNRIDNAAGKMQLLLEDLLELSRIGRMVHLSEYFSMAHLASETVELLHGILQSHHVEVIIQEDMPEVFGDKARFREVYQNLIENAVKFMAGKNNPRIVVGYRMDKTQTVFFVQDFGIGIEKKYHRQIFGLFDKLDPKSDGTGIGLAIVKRIVELHGGTIWVESEPGAGATFCFTSQTVRPAHRAEKNV